MSETRQRHCDICGAQIRKDSGAWMGGTIDWTEAWVTMARVASESDSLHLCRDHIQRIREFIKVMKDE